MKEPLHNENSPKVKVAHDSLISTVFVSLLSSSSSSSIVLELIRNLFGNVNAPDYDSAGDSLP